MLANIQQLREKLERGFYVNNLYEMTTLCKSLALDSSRPTPFFVMQQIFLNIANYWDEKPLIVEEAKLVEVEMKKSLKDLIDGIEVDASSGQIVHLLNKVVSSYLFLFR